MTNNNRVLEEMFEGRRSGTRSHGTSGHEQKIVENNGERTNRTHEELGKETSGTGGHEKRPKIPE